MESTWQDLQKAFVDDHVAMTRGYESLMAAVKAGDFPLAAELAEHVDKIAGPHVEFEERFLYPTVQETRGESYVSRLYTEHDEIVRAIRELASLPPEASPSSEKVARWIEQLTEGLHHAASCGSLLSHLQVQSPEKQRSYLDAIHRLRKQGTRWSELH